MKAQGLRVDILRPADGMDCTNDGISSKVTQAVLIGDEVLCDVFTPRADSPALYLYRRHHILCAIPADLSAHVRNGLLIYLDGWMAGGNYVVSTDSRFPSLAPIAVFDRREW